MIPHPPLGLLAKVTRFLSDVAKLPGRLRVLSAAAEADADARPKCRSCAGGRVGSIRMRTEPGSYTIGAIGTCDRCGLHWWVDTSAGSLQHPLTDQSQG